MYNKTLSISTTLEPSVGIYVGLIGHGILYVSALSYFNIRTSGRRFYKTSFCHFYYLLGVAVSSNVFNNTIDWQNPYARRIMVSKVGLTIAISAGIVLFGFVINEILQWTYSSYDYKKCRDPTMERENNNGQLLMHKHFQIMGYTSAENIPSSAPQHSETTLVVFSLLSRAKNVIMFYFPFYLINIYTTLGNILWFQTNFYVAQWFALGGILISIGLISHYKFQSAYKLSCAFKIVMLILVTCSALSNFPNNAARVLMWVLFMSFGFGYSFSDITTLNMTALKYNELVLAVGYSLEIILIGMIHYYTIFTPNAFFNPNATSYVQIFLRHTISFTVLMCILFMGASFILPRVPLQCLLKIKNYYHFRNFQPTTDNVPLPEYSVSSAYQPHPHQQQVDTPTGWNPQSSNHQHQNPGAYPQGAYPTAPGLYPKEHQQQFPNYPQPLQFHPQQQQSYPFTDPQHPMGMPIVDDAGQVNPPPYSTINIPPIGFENINYPGNGVDSNVNVMKLG